MTINLEGRVQEKNDLASGHILYLPDRKHIGLIVKDRKKLKRVVKTNVLDFMHALFHCLSQNQRGVTTLTKAVWAVL